VGVPAVERTRLQYQQKLLHNNNEVETHQQQEQKVENRACYPKQETNQQLELASAQHSEEETHQYQQQTAVQYPESIATLPPFRPIEGQKWFDQISSQ
jgi:hypothetical protein